MNNFKMNMNLDFVKKLYIPILAFFCVVALRYSPNNSFVSTSYLTFHTTIEVLSVSLSFMIFLANWGIRSRKMTSVVSILSCTYLCVGIFDLLHAFSFKGMPDFISFNSVEKSMYFWLCARLVQSVGFCMLAAFPDKKIKESQYYINLGLSLLALTALSWTIFFNLDVLPHVYLSKTGLTQTKVMAEYVFLALNLFAAVILYNRPSENDPYKKNETLANAALLMVAMGFCFASYSLYNDMMNFWGHILKASSYFYVYRAIIQVELLNPYDEIELVKKKLKVGLDNIKLLEEELERSRKIASLGAEVRSISHDLNNVLMIVSNSANSILKIDNNGENPLVQRKVEQIKQAVLKSQDFLRSLINFSKNIASQKEVIKINGAFSDYSKLLSPLLSKNIQLKFSTENNLDICLARTDLEQLLFNLVLNARDAIGEKDGVIIVDAGNKCLDHSIDFLHYNIPKGEYVCISVEDSGGGIKNEHLSKIFDPFFTTKEQGKGTGIGLATVVSLMQKNNGYVQVETRLGVGTKFSLYFLKSSLVLSDEELSVKSA